MILYYRLNEKNYGISIKFEWYFQNFKPYDWYKILILKDWGILQVSK